MQQCRIKAVTLVLGGVRSGKSRHAQTLAERYHRVSFIATAECRDDPEMQAKIGRHRSQRPEHWRTVEEPLRLGDALEAAGRASDAILVDCLTLFAANLLEFAPADTTAQDAAVSRLCRALTCAACPIILVSNEVGSGVVPAYESGRRFRDLLGEINQQVAALADTVLFMIAGLPLSLKSVGLEVPR